MSDLDITGLRKTFGTTVALADVSITARNGEILALLGPSGCGKTTTLWSIAGLYQPDKGRIAVGGHVLFDSADKVNLPPERRDCGVVFQSYAVWPHLTVRENVAYPLRMRRTKPEARDRRVDEVLELVVLGKHADRYPHQLSGGQQQRVALARALAHPPRLLLLDEPFSNLDAKLREQTRDWLRELQRRIGVTTVFVTHDQDEAMSMSDRIVVMSDGAVHQTGSPEEVYNAPADLFVAGFVGTSNLLHGVVRSRGDGHLCVQVAGIEEPLRVPAHTDAATVTMAVRPERLSLQQDGSEPNTVRVRVHERSYRGDHFRYRLDLAGQKLELQTTHRTDASEVWVHIPPEAFQVYPAAQTPPQPAAAPNDLAAATPPPN